MSYKKKVKGIYKLDSRSSNPYPFPEGIPGVRIPNQGLTEGREKICLENPLVRKRIIRGFSKKEIISEVWITKGKGYTICDGVRCISGYAAGTGDRVLLREYKDDEGRIKYTPYEPYWRTKQLNPTGRDRRLEKNPGFDEIF